MTAEHDPFVAHHEDLVTIHGRLQRALEELSAGPYSGDALAERARWLGRALRWHHHAESAILFPALRRAGRLRTTDVAFLDARDGEHRLVHELTANLLDLVERGRSATPEARTIAVELASSFAAHAAAEELGLAPAALRTMVGAAELRAVGVEVEQARQRWMADGR